MHRIPEFSHTNAQSFQHFLDQWRRHIIIPFMMANHKLLPASAIEGSLTPFSLLGFNSKLFLKQPFQTLVAEPWYSPPNGSPLYVALLLLRR